MYYKRQKFETICNFVRHLEERFNFQKKYKDYNFSNTCRLPAKDENFVTSSRKYTRNRMTVCSFPHIKRTAFI